MPPVGFTDSMVSNCAILVILLRFARASFSEDDHNNPYCDELNSDCCWHQDCGNESYCYDSGRFIEGHWTGRGACSTQPSMCCESADGDPIDRDPSNCPPVSRCDFQACSVRSVRFDWAGGSRSTAHASFGAQLVHVRDFESKIIQLAEPEDGCTPLNSTQDFTNSFALIRRGFCPFVLKSKHAEQAGAIAVIIFNNVETVVAGMRDEDKSFHPVTIPVFLLTKASGEEVKASMAIETTKASLTCQEYDLGEGERETTTGCICQKEWESLYHPDKPCNDYCCNPDADPRGAWCFVNTLVSTLVCAQQGWGYCKSLGSDVMPPGSSARDYFTRFEQGPCRGVSPDHNPDDWHNATKLYPEDCFQTCLDDPQCKAVEVFIDTEEPWPEIDSHCEIWSHEPLSTGPNLVYPSEEHKAGVLRSCLKKTSVLVNSTLKSKSPINYYTAHLNLVCNANDFFDMYAETCREICTENQDCTAYAIRSPQGMGSRTRCALTTSCGPQNLEPANVSGWITYTKHEGMDTAGDKLTIVMSENYARFQDGPCRGIRPDHNPENWYVELPTTDPLTCFDACSDLSDCKAVEVYVTLDDVPRGTHCELWNQEPRTTGLDVSNGTEQKRACFKKSDLLREGASVANWADAFSEHPNLICPEADIDSGAPAASPISLEKCFEACTEDQECISFAFKPWNRCLLSSSCVKADLRPTTYIGWTTYVKIKDKTELPTLRMHAFTFGNFTQFQEGPCRGDYPEHNPLDWYTSLDHVGPKECFASCYYNPACKAVEIHTNALGFPVDEHCEIWSNVPKSTGKNTPYPGNMYRTCFTRLHVVDAGMVLDTSKPLYSVHPKLSCEGKGNLGVAYTYTHDVCREMCTEKPECISYTWSESWDAKKCVMSSTCTEGLLGYTAQSATTYVKVSRHAAMTSRAPMVWQSNFSQFQEGPCRGYSPDHNPYSWYRKASVTQPEECFKACQADPHCKAVELYVRQTDGAPVGDVCELWMHEPNATSTAYRYALNRVLSCFKINQARGSTTPMRALDPTWQAYSRHSKQWCLGRNELAAYDSYSFEMCKYMCTENEDCVAFEWLHNGAQQRCQLSKTCTESALSGSALNWTTYLKMPYLASKLPPVENATLEQSAATKTTTSIHTESSTTTRESGIWVASTTSSTMADFLYDVNGVPLDMPTNVSDSKDSISTSSALVKIAPQAVEEQDDNSIILIAMILGFSGLLLAVCCLIILLIRTRSQLKRQAANPIHENAVGFSAESEAIVIGSPVVGVAISSEEKSLESNNPVTTSASL